jgi:hypothetical protein
MDTTEFLNILAEALSEPGDATRGAFADALMNADDITVRTFDEAMLLTSAEGLVVRLPGGGEFQVTVTQSKTAES